MMDNYHLHRLFKAARMNAEETPEIMPEQLKRRILARWRASEQSDDSLAHMTSLFRRALIGAAIVMFFCIAWSYDGVIDPGENDIALANYEIRQDLLP